MKSTSPYKNHNTERNIRIDDFLLHLFENNDLQKNWNKFSKNVRISLIPVYQYKKNYT